MQFVRCRSGRSAGLDPENLQLNAGCLSLAGRPSEGTHGSPLSGLVRSRGIYVNQAAVAKMSLAR
jgi:hypothetical protein